MIKKIAICLSVILLISGCREKEVVHHEELVYQGEVPPYHGISSLQIGNYVSKIYVDLLGEQPTDAELSAGVDQLKSADVSEAARLALIGEVMTDDRYFDRLFQITSELMLNGMSLDEVDLVYQEYVVIRDFYLSNGEITNAQFFDNELAKLQDVLDATGDLKSGNITINEYYARFCFNLIYDEINMGSENFVVSCFETFYHRYPTEEELSNGVDMVDGNATILLRTDGRSKVDFIDIITSDEEFYTGRVIESYQTYQLRDPDSEELNEATQLLQTSQDYSQMQADIIKTDEYAGF